MYRTKICGITRRQDFDFAIAAGASAIGLNFYPRSKRYVKAEAAASVIESGRTSAAVVGVFVNAEIEAIVEAARLCSLDAVQLHGDEPVERVAEIRGRCDAKIIRAIRCETGAEKLAIAQQQIQQWEAAGIDAVLLDAHAPGEFGGTGATLDWDAVSKLKFSVPWLLAGGLDPENVAAAIAAAKPDGVDVASGVEAMPGVKNESKVASFISNATTAFAAK